MTYAVPGPIRTNIISSTSVGGIDSPFTRTRAVLDMMKGWEIMKAVTEGTEYLRENSEAFLPFNFLKSAPVILSLGGATAANFLCFAE